ncbi:uncharacterized protein LOC121238452 [Juglans microcarpa x Juglans regia]|uniref:uncharacterized protein LOC121238452 n=1 Tax=Juglans microcarpa x Juglans regia TaxID=2249226 RepID=UPI001B7ECF48|nr:uncharacterized protein LOC121238452 [Juglans microcarpa x Juglans regia]
MQHAGWSLVDKLNKEELTDRVRADFELNWTKSNHRETVVMALAQKYNDFHYILHCKYLEYETHEAAISGGTKMVNKAVWECLCERWASEDFKVHWSTKKGKFITEAAEHNYLSNVQTQAPKGENTAPCMHL